MCVSSLPSNVSLDSSTVGRDELCSSVSRAVVVAMSRSPRRSRFGKIGVAQWAGVEYVVAADVMDTASSRSGFGTWATDSPDLDDLMACIDEKWGESYRQVIV